MMTHGIKKLLIMAAALLVSALPVFAENVSLRTCAYLSTLEIKDSAVALDTRSDKSLDIMISEIVPIDKFTCKLSFTLVTENRNFSPPFIYYIKYGDSISFTLNDRTYTGRVISFEYNSIVLNDDTP